MIVLREVYLAFSYVVDGLGKFLEKRVTFSSRDTSKPVDGLRIKRRGVERLI
jgi:hypothetical protein